MKTQNKILFLLIAGLSCAVLFILSIQLIERKEYYLFAQNDYNNKHKLVANILQTSKEKYKQIAYDYSSWSELIDCLKKPDSTWLKFNIRTVIHSFKINYVWIYNHSDSLIYNANSQNASNIQNLNSHKNLENILQSNNSVHFFIKNKNEIIEIFGEKIVSSKDFLLRKEKASGYFFIGKIWDKQFIELLEQNSEMTLILSNTHQPLNIDSSDVLSIRIPLRNLENKPCSYAIFMNKIPLQKTLKELAITKIGVMFSICIILFIVGYYLLNRWITIPLQLLSFSLDTKKPIHVEKMLSRKDEFGKLSHLIQEYFQEKKMLEEEIIQHKKTLEVLKTSELKLQESNDSKDRFFSIIAHDLKSPFNSLIGISGILVQNPEELATEDAIKYVKSLHESAKMGYSILENLLEWSRTQTGRIQVEKSNFYLAEVCHEIITLLQQTADAKKISLKSFITNDIMISADIRMIKTVLRNLVSNAIKFSYSNSSVNISGEIIDDSFRICVTDQGMGIEPEQIPKLFDIANNKTTRGTANEKGTGLGLLLCKEFVEQNGSRLIVESVLGKGSCFSFDLKLVRN